MRGSYVCASRPSRALTEAECRTAEHTDDTAVDAFPKPFPKLEGLYQPQSATSAVVQVPRDTLVTIVSVDPVTKVPNGLHASPSATTNGNQGSARYADMNTVTDGNTIAMPGAAGSVQKEKETFFINRMVGHRRAEAGMQNRAQQYGYDR